MFLGFMERPNLDPTTSNLQPNRRVKVGSALVILTKHLDHGVLSNLRKWDEIEIIKASYLPGVKSPCS